jgi:hypothetical protein
MSFKKCHTPAIPITENMNMTIEYYLDREASPRRFFLAQLALLQGMMKVNTDLGRTT